LQARSDEQLARQAQDGDTSALNELLTRHRNSVFFLSWRIIGKREDALDATQETMMRVCRHLQSYDPNRAFAAWLRRVTVRASLDRANKIQKRQEQTSPEEFMDQRQGPFEFTFQKELKHAVAQAVQTLSPAQRVAFVCKELEGMDTREIANAIGCLRTTVRWHLYEARKKLALQLAPFGGGLK
jgi:RNA polymerase sigma-70 factor, ECF subfamily